MAPRAPADLLAGTVEQAIETLYGPLPDAPTISHVAAVWAAPDGSLPVLVIDQASPASEVDAFALDLSRARADVIITTGEILRREPALRYDLRSRYAAELLHWRRTVLRREHPPHVIVLTRGNELPNTHPAFASWARPVVFTSSDQRARLERHMPRVELAGVPAPTLDACIEHARARLSARAISLECGPRTMRSFHARGEVDELLLSVYRGAPPRTLEGFVTEHRLREAFEEPHPGCTVLESSGPWSFHRYVRGRRA